MEINRYQRLTPLVVADKSLEGDLGNVRKGDCAVTFSRTGLFELKRRIETATRLRCALAYGRLPPEIRSEQAALVMKEIGNSGYAKCKAISVVKISAVGRAVLLYARVFNEQGYQMKFETRVIAVNSMRVCQRP